MKNIELKASVNNFKEIIPTLKKIGARYKDKLHQVDTYYYSKKGRLKLREINGKNFELIFYQRLDKDSSKISNYQILKIRARQLEIVKSILKKAFGERVVIKKERNLWIYKNTRIHLDNVEHLGNFIELETVLNKINLKEAKEEHSKVMDLLDLSACQKINKSYSDLLIKK